MTFLRTPPAAADALPAASIHPSGGGRRAERRAERGGALRGVRPAGGRAGRRFSREDPRAARRGNVFFSARPSGLEAVSAEPGWELCVWSSPLFAVCAASCPPPPRHPFGGRETRSDSTRGCWKRS